MDDGAMRDARLVDPGGEPLCYLSAGACLARFRDGTLSPAALVEALIDRIDRVNPAVNALADRYFGEARAQAAAAARTWRSGAPRPLEGVPVLVKDAQRIAGRRTTFGSEVLLDAPPDDISDPMIERLQAAGAIILARTTTPEFCLSAVCHSRAWGITRNPFNTAFGPGGSSGGSGAALAAGFAPLATGTDIGGSIRIPASCCGVVGYKPPHGRNPDGPPANFDRYNHCGPLARTVADLALVQEIVAGAHPRDHDSLRASVVLPRAAGPIAGLRIAVSMDLGYLQIAPEVRQNTLAALDVFRGLGATVTEVELGWSPDCDAAAVHWYNTMHFHRMALTHAGSGRLTDYAMATAEGVARTRIEDVSRSWEVQNAMYQRFGPIMEAHDVFVCPTLAIPAVPADHDPTQPGFTVNGVPADPEFGWALAHQFNMLHNCPAMSVPSGVAPSGVPTGLQIVGRTFDDAAVFRAALAYEAASPFRW